jgi:hypothetical protein
MASLTHPMSSEEVRESFARDGFLLLPGVVDEG